MHAHICEKLFTKNIIFELGIGIVSSFYGMAFKTIRKRALRLLDCSIMYQFHQIQQPLSFCNAYHHLERVRKVGGSNPGRVQIYSNLFTP